MWNIVFFFQGVKYLHIFRGGEFKKNYIYFRHIDFIFQEEEKIITLVFVMKEIIVWRSSLDQKFFKQFKYSSFFLLILRKCAVLSHVWHVVISCKKLLQEYQNMKIFIINGVMDVATHIYLTLTNFLRGMDNFKIFQYLEFWQCSKLKIS